MTQITATTKCRGFSLIEMLVATAIFSIAAAVAFILYSAAQKSYKLGDNAAEQQQATRVAFDRMISDLRLAGFNHNPDGDKTRVDEQIEGAWDTAITVRGDFDFEDPTASVTPEVSLAGTAYNIVSTGNDEVVTYALAKPGPAGPDTLTVRIDPDRPRTKTVKTVTIPNVALVHDNPPYTLYRITLTDVAGAFPSSPQAASAFTYEPVAENIRSLSLTYTSVGGFLVNADTPDDPSDDIGGDDSTETQREQIRRIHIDLVGMTPDEDLDYTDVGESIAVASHFRKFDLQTDINPENLGKAGVKDLDITPPDPPTNVTLVPDHCQGMLVTWDQPSSTAGVSSYVVKYYPSGSPSAFSTVGTTYPHIDYGIVDHDGHAFVTGLTMGADYCFQVQAKDSAGNQSGWSPGSSPPCATVTEVSTPGTPLNLAATGGGSLSPLDSEINITWDELQANANTVNGDPDLIGSYTILRDGAGYKLYRGETAGFTPNDATNLVAGPSVIGNGVTQYSDTNIVNCRDYYYKLVAMDRCDIAGGASAESVGRAETTVAPMQPTGLSGSKSGGNNIDLAWTPVTSKVDATPTVIDIYNIYRYQGISGIALSSLPLSSFSLIGTTSVNSYTDTLGPTENAALNQGYSFYYAVTAADACGNESEKSDPSEVYCDFSGDLVVSPGDGDSNAGIVLINLNVVNGTDNYLRARVRIPNPDVPATFLYDQEVFSFPFDFPAWDTSAVGNGTYSIFWEVENDSGCIQTLATSFEVSDTLACQITPMFPDLSPTKGSPTDQNTRLEWDIVNNAGKDLEIIRIEASWTSIRGEHRLLAIEYPSGTVVKSYQGGLLGGLVDAVFSIFPLLFPVDSSSGCSGNNCVRMAMQWDTSLLDNSTGVGETITVRYTIRDSSGTTGSCSFTIKPESSGSGGGGGGGGGGEFDVQEIPQEEFQVR
jgi:prepilin-type N-terminal cleavage/methylation domain-containing protein